MAGKFEVFRDLAGQYRFRLKARNGEIILASEGYNSKTGALNGIESVKKNAVDPSRFEKKESRVGRAFFTLRAQNGQVIGVSETYLSQGDMEAGVRKVQSAVQAARTEDQTR